MATMHQMDTILSRAIRKGYNVMFRSQPALGKTTGINKLADRHKAEDPNFFFLQLDGGTLAPTDVVMSMPKMEENQIVRLIDGRIPNAYKTPDMRGLIYIGEFMLMSLEVSRGFQKFINHEDLGGFKVPEGVVFVADGNRLKDRSGAQAQSRAVGSRFLQVELEYDADYALDVVKAHYHPRVSSCLIRNPLLLDNYAEVFEAERSANDLMAQEGKNGVWANLRSWKRVSDMLFDVDAGNEPLVPDEICCSVGSGVGKTFEVFNKMIDNLASVEEIRSKPKDAPVPERMDERYGLSTMLAMTVTKEYFSPISVYMNRFPAELQASFFRLMNDRLAKAKDGNTTAIRASAEYKKWITAPHISKLLLGASAS